MTYVSKIYQGEIVMVLEKIKKILSEQFSVDESAITENTNIADDLGADSLDVVDIMMSIEDEFEMEMPDEAVDNVRTVGELVNFIKKSM